MQKAPAREPPRGRLTGAAVLNAAAALLDYLGKTVVQLAITPVLVSELGRTLYGIWQILSRLATYITPADGRPTQALKWVIANQQEEGNERRNRRAVGSALAVWMMLLPVFAVVGAALVFLAPEITGADPALAERVRVASVILIINLGVSTLATLPQAVLEGMNLGYKRMGFVAGVNVLAGLLMVGAVLVGLDIVGLAIATFASTVTSGVLFWFLARRYVRWFGIEWTSFAEVRRFGGISFWYAAAALMNKLLRASDVLVLGWIASATAVTTYTLSRYSVSTVLALGYMMIGAVAPGLGSLISAGNARRVVEVRDEMFALTAVISAVLGGTILVVNPSFVTLWVGPENYAGAAANFLIVLVAVQWLFIQNETFVIALTLDVSVQVLLGIVAALLSIGLSFRLVPSHGIVGLCLSILAGRFLLTLAYPIITRNFLGADHARLLLRAVRPVVLLLALLAFLGWVGSRLLLHGWLQLVFATVASVLLLAPLSFLVLVHGNLRSRLRQRARMLWEQIRDRVTS